MSILPIHLESAPYVLHVKHNAAYIAPLPVSSACTGNTLYTHRHHCKSAGISVLTDHALPEGMHRVLPTGNVTAQVIACIKVYYTWTAAHWEYC